MFEVLSPATGEMIFFTGNVGIGAAPPLYPTYEKSDIVFPSESAVYTSPAFPIVNVGDAPRAPSAKNAQPSAASAPNIIANFI